MNIEVLRREYHREICQRVLYLEADDVPNVADKNSQASVFIAWGIVKRFGLPLLRKPPTSEIETGFEEATRHYLEKAFCSLQHLRPGKWIFSDLGDAKKYDGYEHLADLAEVLDQRKDLKATLGEYLIKPDILIGRAPVSDEEINRDNMVLDGEQVSRLTPLRATNSTDQRQILHASISCKWTIRSDRSQNARTEGLNLIRNRKGHTPHIVIVTAEPYPQRIASVALGTGDIDCVYHFALPELEEAAEEYDNPAVIDMLDILVAGKRLRDISDLPFDLAA